MKKRSLLALAMVGALSVSMLAGCGSSSTKETQAPAGSEAATEAATEAAKESTAAGDGKVYYLNFKPEQDAQWQELAKLYTEETGVPVTVLTAASGNYETTLKSEMAKTDAPTLFQVNGPVGLASWKDYCYDLKDSKIAGELTNDEFALMKKVAEDITARKDELGFSAFTSAGMDGSSDWRFKTHLANLPIYYEYKADDINTTDAIKGTYLDNYRNIWDLYINNATCDPSLLSTKTGDDAVAEFVTEQAVFYQNGTWAYNDVAELGDDNLGMLPIYIGAEGEDKQGLCTGTENYWCVNNKASEADIQATLDFMYWCVTSEVGTKAMCGGEGAMPSGDAGMGFVIPFKGNLESSNPLVNIANQYVADGYTPVAWTFSTMPSEEWKNGVGSALTTYAADQTDDNWAAVVSAFVDGWAKEAAASK